MTELFESTIDNVSELEVRGYSDPVKMERTMEIWAKTGDEEYVYKFTGPGVKIANIPMFDDCLKLSKEIEKPKKDFQEIREAFPNGEGELKVENKDTYRVDNVLVNVDTFDRLLKENEKLKQENRKLRVDKGYNVTIHGKDYTPFELVDRIFELERLKTPTIENFADEEPRTRADILDQAEKCVCGQREQDYGTPESNFQLIADLWNGYLGFMDHPQDQIRATDVAMMMALMKIARIRNGGGSGDSFVDLAGYAACGGEIWHGERHSNT